MSDNDLNNLGRQIESFVETAVDSLNFQQLNKNISKTITSVFDELNIGASDTGKTASGSQPRYHYAQNKSGEQTKSGTQTKPAILRYAKYPPGSISGGACTAVGSILGAGGGIVLLVGFILGAAMKAPVVSGILSAVGVPLFAAGLILFGMGASLRGRVRRFKTYIRILGSRKFCNLTELAQAVHKKTAFVASDLRKMIDKRFFKEAYLDSQETCLIVDRATYEQYLSTQTSYASRIQSNVDAGAEQTTNAGDVSPEVKETIKEGAAYIRQIHAANDDIQDVDISNKLYRLEEILKKIFQVLEKKQNQLPKLRKFMNYYMPTTIKLVQAYRELDLQPVAGENVRRSKEEIAHTLDTINDAYEQLLDSFYEDDVIDISTDISVLQTMLAQEGLTKRDF